MALKPQPLRPSLSVYSSASCTSFTSDISCGSCSPSCAPRSPSCILPSYRLPPSRACSPEHRHATSTTISTHQSAIVVELRPTRCRLVRLGIRRRRRGEIDVEDHGAVLMAEYRRRTQAQGVREGLSLAHARAHARVHRSRGAPRNAGRAPRAGREAHATAAERKPRPSRRSRSRGSLSAHGCIGL